MIKYLRIFRDYLDHYGWVLKGKPIPVSHVFKRKRIRHVAKHFGCRVFVETGTFYGQMIEALRRSFSDLFSVELSESLYQHCKEKFARDNHVHLYQGDSAKELPRVLMKIDDQAIFWLDGHYSGPGTAKGDVEGPIVGELDAIRNHHIRDHCILIDDARCFTGSDGYPTIEKLRLMLLQINPNYDVAVENDCIIALPHRK